MSTDYFAHSATETGYNHIKMGKVCEDSSGYYDDEKMHICVVADGHGSDNYPRTDRGSRYAVDVTIECIREFVQLVDSDRANWWNLKLTIIRIRDAHHFANTIASLRKIFNNVSCESQKGAVVPPVFLPRSTGSETVPGFIFNCLSYYEAALYWHSEAQLPSLLFIMMHPQVSLKDCRRIAYPLV